MLRLQIRSTDSHPPLQLRLGTTRPFWVGMRRRVVSDEIVHPQRRNGGQEPSLVFTVRQHYFARQPASRSFRPPLHLGTQLGRAISIAIEYDEDRLAGALTTRDLYGLHNAGFACQPIAGSTNGRPNLDLPRSGLVAQAPQQDRQGLDFAVALYDWLDFHSIPGHLGRSSFGPKGV